MITTFFKNMYEHSVIRTKRKALQHIISNALNDFEILDRYSLNCYRCNKRSIKTNYLLGINYEGKRIAIDYNHVTFIFCEFLNKNKQKTPLIDKNGKNTIHTIRCVYDIWENRIL